MNRRTAIVILNWNGASMMHKYLPSVIESSPEADVIVADNGSTDESLDMLTSKFPTVRQIVLDRNWGFAEGYNKAIAQLSDYEYCVLLNSDVRCTAGWLAPLLAYMDTHSEVAACQPKLLSDTEPTLFEYAGACGGYIDRWGYPYCRGRIFETVEADEGQYSAPVYKILWATGACLMIRTADYQAANGLDARFFAHNEEIDLCWRLWRMGREVVCITSSKAYHLGGGTLPQGNPRKVYLNFRNNLTMLYKNLAHNQLLKVMAMRLVLDYVAAFKMLLVDRRPQDFMAVVRARHDFLRWRKSFTAEREQLMETELRTHAKAHTSLPKYLAPFSILWQYHARGRKLFSSLPEFNIKSTRA